MTESIPEKIVGKIWGQFLQAGLLTEGDDSESALEIIYNYLSDKP